MTVSAVVFDAYGTLFDVTAAARAAAREPGCAAIAKTWPRIAATWRDKQLQYTWLRAVTGYYSDFWRVTQDALDWTLEAEGHDDPALRDRLLALYRQLDTFPEVPDTLRALKDRGLTLAILSNGTEAMLHSAIASAGIGDTLDDVLSVDTIGVYKPDAAVYDLVEERLGILPGQTLFVSSNGWDVASAAAYGFRTLWVNRAGAPRDRLPVYPDRQAPDLTTLPDLVDAARTPAAATPAQTAFCSASDGLRLAYRDEGSREGPVLLCLAGLTRNMRDFDFVVRDFGDRARIVRLDTRGRGESAHDPDYHNYNLIRESRDAIDLLDHLDITRAAILGTSRGGLIGMLLGRGHRDRITGLCLNDIGPVIETEGLAYIASYLGIVPTYRTYEAAADGLLAATAATFPGVPRARWRLHAERIWRQTDDGLALRYDGNLRRAVLEASATGAIDDLWPFYDALAGLPLGVIHGENSDILSAATVAEMKRRRPDLIHADVPRRGHVPFLDERESRRAISDFLDRLPAGAEGG